MNPLKSPIAPLSSEWHQAGRLSWLAMALLLLSCSPDAPIAGPGISTAGGSDGSSGDVTVGDGGTALDSVMPVVDTTGPTVDTNNPQPDASSDDTAAGDDVDADPVPDTTPLPDVIDPEDGAGAPSTLCNPCESSNECGDLAACVDRGAYGAYCGQDCTTDADCAVGYTCVQATDVEGSASQQCLPAPVAGGGPAGACTCSHPEAEIALAG